MTAATLPPWPASPAERLAVLIDGLRADVAAHGARGLLTVALQLLLWARLSRMAMRARRLAARMAAGERFSIRPPRPKAAAPRATPSRPYIRLPRGVLWLVRVVPGTAVGAARLRYLLDDPAMVEAARSPPMRRLLRPLCRMLGVDPPPPKPPGPPRPAPPPPRPAVPPPEAAAPTPGVADPCRPSPQPPAAACPAIAPAARVPVPSGAGQAPLRAGAYIVPLTEHTTLRSGARR